MMTITTGDKVDRFIAKQTKAIYDRCRDKGIDVRTLVFTGDMASDMNLVIAENERLLKLLDK